MSDPDGGKLGNVNEWKQVHNVKDRKKFGRNTRRIKADADRTKTRVHGRGKGGGRGRR